MTLHFLVEFSGKMEEIIEFKIEEWSDTEYSDSEDHMRCQESHTSSEDFVEDPSRSNEIIQNTQNSHALKQKKAMKRAMVFDESNNRFPLIYATSSDMSKRFKKNDPMPEAIQPRNNILFVKYFQVVSKTSKGMSAQCFSCSKLLSGYANSSSNFLTHLKKVSNTFLSLK